MESYHFENSTLRVELFKLQKFRNVNILGYVQQFVQTEHVCFDWSLFARSRIFWNYLHIQNLIAVRFPWHLSVLKTYIYRLQAVFTKPLFPFRFSIWSMFHNVANVQPFCAVNGRNSYPNTTQCVKWWQSLLNGSEKNGRRVGLFFQSLVVLARKCFCHAFYALIPMLTPKDNSFE